MFSGQLFAILTIFLEDGFPKHNSPFASNGAGYYKRHGARLAAESDWVLLARVADRLCEEGEGERQPRGENKPFTAFA